MSKSFTILIFLITFLAIILRTYNYFERVSVVADNSRDAQVATYAAANHKLPLTGNFASAGPFFYGPWWYYFLELVSFTPLGPLKLWYAATALSLLFVFLIFKVGQEIENKFLGAIAALFAALSPAQIQNSFTIWNPSVTPLLVLVSLLFAIRSLKKPALINLLFLGFFTILAFTIHFQNMLIFPIPIVTLIFLWLKIQSKKEFFLRILFLALGALIPLLPLLYFDITHHWFDSRNFLVYLLVDQYKIWVPNRWLTYLGVYWPQTVGYIVGGNKLISYLIFLLVGGLTLLNLKNMHKSRPYYLIAIAFLLELILFRFYRGERYLYLSLFSHPSILLMTAWSTYKIIKINRVIGFSLLAFLTTATVNRSILDLHVEDITLSEVLTTKEEIIKTFPNSTFNIWSCAVNGTRVSHPLAYFIYKEGRENLNGVNIGVCETPEKTISWSLISKKDLQIMYGKTPFYSNVATARVYESTVEWWQKSPPPKGEGDLLKFIWQNAFRN